MPYPLGPYRDHLLRLKDVQKYLRDPAARNQFLKDLKEEEVMSHTTQTDTPALTFVHNGTPDNGDLSLVIDVKEAEKFTKSRRRDDEYGYNSITVENENFLNRETVTVTVPYNMIRDFVLDQLRNHEIAVLEQMTSRELLEYYTGKMA